jgi:hypothetical protein
MTHLEVVRAVRYVIRFIAQPFHHIFDADKELLLFLLRVGVIISQVSDTILTLKTQK